MQGGHVEPARSSKKAHLHNWFSFFTVKGNSDSAVMRCARPSTEESRWNSPSNPRGEKKTRFYLQRGLRMPWTSIPGDSIRGKCNGSTTYSSRFISSRAFFLVFDISLRGRADHSPSRLKLGKIWEFFLQIITRYTWGPFYLFISMEMNLVSDFLFYGVHIILRLYQNKL